ncbi:MAG: EF-P lysine aminoacylase GenX [Chlamydiia bacterium]|nr:EF-P lysine aminoacylase GenX [Chlamydiia bacterium]
MSLAQTTKLEILRDRASMFGQARTFFQKRGIIEVDCPILTQEASVDAYIDLLPATYCGKEVRYLHSSPEYGMKRLLAEGIGDIYQLSHVFRDGECGEKHNPEFTMAEWYRVGLPFHAMIAETLDFVRLFIGDHPAETLTYRQAFLAHTSLDPFLAPEKALLEFCQTNQIPYYPNLLEEGRDALLNLILGAFIEPKFQGLVALTSYPASQAALAKTRQEEGVTVADRFEIYYNGVELANGYHELSDPEEQLRRFQEANKKRTEPLPIDTRFLSALHQGFPDCCGVAVGFDRLMMLRHNTSHIRDILPFGWQEA